MYSSRDAVEDNRREKLVRHILGDRSFRFDKTTKLVGKYRGQLTTTQGDYLKESGAVFSFNDFTRDTSVSMPRSKINNFVWVFDALLFLVTH